MSKLSDLKKATLSFEGMFEQEFSASVDSVIGQIIQYKYSVLGWLRSEKEQFSANAEADIKEAQSNLAEGLRLLVY